MNDGPGKYVDSYVAADFNVYFIDDEEVSECTGANLALKSKTYANEAREDIIYYQIPTQDADDVNGYFTVEALQI
jgi:hypothetical protein